MAFLSGETRELVVVHEMPISAGRGSSGPVCSAHAAPDVAEAEAAEGMRLVTLDAPVRMKLASFRDRMHPRDLIDVGLVDAAWCRRLPPDLARRLKALLDDPNG
jgi:hypothetical protein